MSLYLVVGILIVAGILLGLFNKYAPPDMFDPTVKRIINVVVIVALVLWLINLFFGTGWMNIKVGR